MVSSLRTSAVHLLVFCTLLRCGLTGVMAKPHECMRTYSCISISACKTAHCWHYAKCATLWPRPDAAGSASTEACLYHFATLSCIRSKNIITRTFFFFNNNLQPWKKLVWNTPCPASPYRTGVRNWFWIAAHRCSTRISGSDRLCATGAYATCCTLECVSALIYVRLR